MSLPSPLGQIYSMQEATVALRCSRRFLQDLIKKYPFYASKGGRKMFSEDDIRDLWKAMRCPSPSQSEASTTISAAPSGASPYMRALERATRKSQSKPARRARTS